MASNRRSWGSFHTLLTTPDQKNVFTSVLPSTRCPPPLSLCSPSVSGPAGDLHWLPGLLVSRPELSSWMHSADSRGVFSVAMRFCLLFATWVLERSQTRTLCDRTTKQFIVFDRNGQVPRWKGEVETPVRKTRTKKEKVQRMFPGKLRK